LRHWLHEDLVWEVLRLGMVREVLGVFLLKNGVDIFKLDELGLRQDFDLLTPDDGHAHELAGVSNNGASQVIGVH